MSKGRTQPPEMFMAATRMGQTQVLAFTKPCFVTTVFRLPGNPRRQQSLASYTQQWPLDRSPQSLNRTIETHRTSSPDRQDYNDLLRKYRDRLKQQRKKHLKQLDEQANYCIRGGHLHNRMNLKNRNESCPKVTVDYEKVCRIISDIHNNQDPSKAIAEELSKLPFLRKRHLERHHRPSPLHLKHKISNNSQERSKSCNRADDNAQQKADQAQLVPWRSINEQDEGGDYSPNDYT